MIVAFINSLIWTIERFVPKTMAFVTLNFAIVVIVSVSLLPLLTGVGTVSGEMALLLTIMTSKFSHSGCRSFRTLCGHVSWFFAVFTDDFLLTLFGNVPRLSTVFADSLWRTFSWHVSLGPTVVASGYGGRSALLRLSVEICLFLGFSSKGSLWLGFGLLIDFCLRVGMFSVSNCRKIVSYFVHIKMRLIVNQTDIFMDCAHVQSFSHTNWRQSQSVWSLDYWFEHF